ncbi:MAG: preprotein translocase subunit SecG [Deltaproteobacteria bacterium]|nr:preprotein translocase subunit SecG [Deltaproteobacteria bacterium]
MQPLLLIVHVIVCLVLIAVILVQAGKGASIGAVFGGGSAQTLFGARGPATFFQKFTTGAVVVFLFTSISLARYAKEQRSSSVIDSVPINTLAPESDEGNPLEGAPMEGVKEPATKDETQ